MTKYLYVISFDGLSTLDFDYAMTLPNFKEYMKEASYCKKVYSVYPSLTYPAHATIVTGRYPSNHGVINNTLLQPDRESPDWYWHRKYIQGDTFYDLAIKRGKKVAAILWPVTSRSKIQYNLPEIFANRFWQNQIMVSLFSGSPLYEFTLYKKFGHLVDGLKQPNLDNFVHEGMIYTINNKKADINFVHYTDLDTMRHRHGFYSKEAKEAIMRHDKRLGDIIKALKENNTYEDSTIIILGDHSSLDEDKIVNLNVLLREKGYIKLNEKGKVKDYQVISKSCDGSAYIYLKEKSNSNLTNIVYNLIDEFNKKNNCIETIYTGCEAANLGADPECTFMLEAKTGYYFLDDVQGEIIREIKPEESLEVPHVTKATHGYLPFKRDYTTIFMAAGKGIKKGVVLEEMKLVDEAPTMAKLLGLELQDVDGRILEEILE